MAKALDYRLYVGYLITDDVPWGSLDQPLEDLAEQHGFDRAGAGTDFIGRDIDFVRPEPLSEDQRQHLEEALRAIPGLYSAAYAEEMWDYDTGDYFEDESTTYPLVFHAEEAG